ncbi:MAG: DUF4124 domain-containing protein [Zoogloeaceae bacterium]|jgi:hypothetical protein|nr:DUF4124 domain-containing protein [Zoogloeaceae bacterium]
MMKKNFLLLILCLFSCGVSAQQVYKCLENGKVTISTQPCPPGATSTVIPVEASPNPPISPEEEVARLKQKADAMEQERLNRQAERAAANAPPPLPQTGDAEEAVNAHGRLNAARRKREEANKPPPPPPSPPSVAPGGVTPVVPGASGARSMNSNSGAPKSLEI